MAAFYSQAFGQNMPIDPAILAGSQDLLLQTVTRTNELIDNLPDMRETGRQMAELWDIAYPQLRSLLAKAGAWANQVPTPAGGGSPTTYAARPGNSYSSVSYKTYGSQGKKPWFP